MIYLPDTDIINYILKGVPPTGERFRAALAAGDSFALSAVVHYQVLRYLNLRGSSRLLRLYTRLTSGWLRVEMETDDWDIAADLWAERHRAGTPIEDADLLIAVAALKVGACLVTNNERHFEGLGLTIENWTVPATP